MRFQQKYAPRNSWDVLICQFYLKKQTQESSRIYGVIELKFGLFCGSHFMCIPKGPEISV